jgi:hypothetical protein
MLPQSQSGDSQLRRQGHIFTDKAIYRTKDVIFIEALVLDAFQKTPTAMISLEQFMYVNYMTLMIYNPMGVQVYSS